MPFFIECSGKVKQHIERPYSKEMAQQSIVVSAGTKTFLCVSNRGGMFEFGTGLASFPGYCVGRSWYALLVTIYPLCRYP